MAVDNLRSVTSKLIDQTRRRAVRQINTQMQQMLTTATVDVLQQSLQATAIRKPSPGSMAQILNVLT